MVFDQNQIDELLEIISYNQTLFIARQVGPEILSDKDHTLLSKFGVKLSKYKGEIPTTEAAYRFGILAEALGDQRTKSLSFNDFKKYLAAGNYIPLTSSEEVALKTIKLQAYNDIKGLSSKIQKDFYQKNIEIEATKAVEQRLGVKELMLNLQAKTGDYDVDFGRISDYIMHSSYETGRLKSIEDKYGSDAQVYKEVYLGACKHCIRLYLTAGIGSQPIIWKLSKLEANGTNIGRKVHEWRATVGPIHPWCRCTLHYIPNGYTWDNEKKMFLLKDFKPKIERKSVIKIQVGSKKFEV